MEIFHWTDISFLGKIALCLQICGSFCISELSVLISLQLCTMESISLSWLENSYEKEEKYVEIID
jgi:hypothetical protein